VITDMEDMQGSILPAIHCQFIHLHLLNRNSIMINTSILMTTKITL